MSLTIEPGEFITLLGPSGSGKTTTLNLIAGFRDAHARARSPSTTPTSATLPPHKRNLGMLFQNYALFPHMNGGAQHRLSAARARHGQGRDRRRVRDVLDLGQLRSATDAYPTQLSGGQQQRVALARAIVFEPRVLLCSTNRWQRSTAACAHAANRNPPPPSARLALPLCSSTHDQEEAMSAVGSHRAVQRRPHRADRFARDAAKRSRRCSPRACLGDSNVVRAQREARSAHSACRGKAEGCGRVEPATDLARAAVVRNGADGASRGDVAVRQPR